MRQGPQNTTCQETRAQKAAFRLSGSPSEKDRQNRQNAQELLRSDRYTQPQGRDRSSTTRLRRSATFVFLQKERDLSCFAGVKDRRPGRCSPGNRENL